MRLMGYCKTAVYGEMSLVNWVTCLFFTSLQFFFPGLHIYTLSNTLIDYLEYLGVCIMQLQVFKSGNIVKQCL